MGFPKQRKKYQLTSLNKEKKNRTIITQSLTLVLSRMEPLPRIDIFVMVSSCNLFKEFPFGPNNFPTKLNCKKKNKF